MPAVFSAIWQWLPREYLMIALVAVLGAAAVYLLLPRPRGYPWVLGALVGAAALLLAGFQIVRATARTPETFLFYAFSGVAVVAGTLLVTQRNAARAALAFALVVLSTCGLFLLLAAPFLMAATAIVYAGAIVVTFLFVIMLAQQEGLSNADQRSREPLLASVAGFLLLGTLLYVLGSSHRQDAERHHWLLRVQRLANDVDALSRARPSAGEQPPKQTAQVVQELRKLLDELRPEQEDPPTTPAMKLGGDELERAASGAKHELALQEFRLGNDRPVEWDKLLIALARVSNFLGGGPQPHEDAPLSALSGPAPNDDLRRDAQGRPRLPAENVAYLGRSLFTDYLIAVELGGTLLLVATIGAIAIAQRRAEGP